MTREEKLELAARIGAEFNRREMKVHRNLLAGYWRALRRGREPEAWNDALVIDWAKAFQLKPFEGTEIRPMCSDCPCGNMKEGGARPMVFPGGWLVTCLACARQWLELQQGGQR